jgi:hypothetical protein
LPGFCAVPADGVTVIEGAVAAGVDWLGAFAGVCAAAGVSPAAAKAIAHPINLIFTLGSGRWSPSGAGVRQRNLAAL